MKQRQMRQRGISPRENRAYNDRKAGRPGRSALAVWACCTAAALAFGCGDSGSGASPAATGLVMTTLTDSEIAGTYSDPVTTLHFSSRETAPGVVVAEVGTSAAKLTMNVDYNAGEVETDGSASIFSPEEVDALRALEGELDTVVSGDDDAPRVEAALRSLGTMASEADAGEIFPSVSSVSDRSWVTIACTNTCRTLYRSCGGSYYKQTGISSPNCKGRCGAGCDDARNGTSNHVWSMDCAEHDYHLGPVGDCVDDITFASKTHCTYSPAEFCATNCSCADGPGC